MYITASLLYDYIQCPHRVWRDKHGPQDEKLEEINPFVQLLWDKGVLHEKAVIGQIENFVDLSEGSLQERFEKTVAEIKNGTSIIYQGVLIHNNLLGIPDLLRKQPNGTYIPIDIKSGRGFEGTEEEDNEKQKKHYAVQLCLYVEILKNLGFANEDKGIILDIKNKENIYNLNEFTNTKSKKTWWEFYNEILDEVQKLVINRKQNKPAYASICKLCPWYNSCKDWCKLNNDLTNIFNLGRVKRDIINSDLGIERIENIFSKNIDELLIQKAKDKRFLYGFGEKTLKQIYTRAHIYHNTKKPVIHNVYNFPKTSVELFFDIEDDPTREFVYLHGVYERKGNKEKYIKFLANDLSRKSEEKAWKEFWDYIKSLPKDDFSVYYYSPHEKTIYKKLKEQYPDILLENELEEFFENPSVIDLYNDVVLKNTDWPLSSYSIKDLAHYFGFDWRDTTPSGALSIQWYNEYLKTGDESILNRILEYNEDDCKATMVVKDNIEKLQKEIFNI